MNILRYASSPQLRADNYIRSLSPAIWLPLNRMSVGRSGNLLTNGDMEAGTDGWTDGGLRATIESETTIIKSGTKSLKVTCNDATGTGPSFASQAIADYTKYLNITATLTGWGYALSTNDKTQLIRLADNLTGHSTYNIPKTDTWTYLTTSHKFSSSATSCAVLQRGKAESAADTNDVAYFDDISLTVPQSLSWDNNRRICHPEGCIWTPQGFYFDGTDDLVTTESDWIGTSACTVWGWFKATGWGGNNAGRILDNRKISLYPIPIYTERTNVLYFSSDYGGNLTFSANNSISLNTLQFFAVTRAADGTTNFYIGNLTTRPALSGAANQASGAPAAGTTNVVVGNRLAGDRAFAGNIPLLGANLEVLSLSRIERIWELTRGLI